MSGKCAPGLQNEWGHHILRTATLAHGLPNQQDVLKSSPTFAYPNANMECCLTSIVEQYLLQDECGDSLAQLRANVHYLKT